jgi:dTDP-4-amino-4,6-dideoxygalactose transaminase
MVTTNNEDYARTIRMLRDWGTESKYCHKLKGYNYRMEGLQGAVLRVKLRHLDKWTEQRRANAGRYNELLKEMGIKTPCERPYNRHVYHIYAIRVPLRDTFQSKLTAQGISSGIHYPVPVHLQPAYADLGYKAGNFPKTESAASEVLSLPMFPELTPLQQDTVVKAVHEAQKELPGYSPEKPSFTRVDEQEQTLGQPAAV